MRSTLLAASSAFALALVCGGAALAEEAPEQPPPPASAGGGTSSSSAAVLVFTPDYFADQNPSTALDMVNRVPGFRLNDGDGSRSFEGAVGNVLIGGSRPPQRTTPARRCCRAPSPSRSSGSS